MNENRNLNCLYNVFLPTGMVRMTDREATRAHGPEIWEHFGEVIDHSEFCDQHPEREATRWVPPFGEVTQPIDPPF